MNRPKIIPRIIGGLGNQLFCYAAARRLAIVNNAELVIDDVSGFERDHTYQRSSQLDHFNIQCRKASPAERLEPLSRVRRYLKREVNRRKPFEKRSYIKQEGVEFDSRLTSFEPLKDTYLEGYWQSENYFKDIEPTIRQDLRIIPPLDEMNLTTADNIRNCLSVAVHLRFFDAPKDHGINNAPVDYYARAIAKMENIAPCAHYFIFSDRPSVARQVIPLPDYRITVISHNHGDDNAYADLWLMTQCDHFVIANSTFSWWGAWLATHGKKQVIAPGFEMGEGKMSWGFDGLLPRSWIKL